MLRRDLYTVPDIAKLLHIGEEQTRRILSAGKIKGARLTGKHYTVTNAALREYLGEPIYNCIIDSLPAEEIEIRPAADVKEEVAQ